MNNLEKHPKIKNTLLQIASVLNKNKVNWGLGGSLLLYIYGIDTTIADIDIVIDINDINKIEEISKRYSHITKNESGIYKTERFYSITLDGIDIDLMIGFKILTKDSIYFFPSGKKLIKKKIILDETVINICSLRDWLNAYTAMRRDNKVKLIEQSKLVK